MVLKWRDRERLERIAGVLSWPVHFAHLIPAFGQNDREEACVVCQVCTFMCPGNELSPPPPPLSTHAVFHSPFSPKHTCRVVYLTPDSLSLSLSLSLTYTHARDPRKLPVQLVLTLSLSLSLSLSHTHTHTHTEVEVLRKTVETDEGWGRVQRSLKGQAVASRGWPSSTATLAAERWGR